MPDIPMNIREARLEDAPEMARILVETNQATFRGRVPDPCLTSFTIEESAHNWTRTLSPGGLDESQFILIAETRDGQIAGYVMAGGVTEHPDYPYELHVLMVDTPHQRQGIGQRLMTEVAQRLARQGAKGFLLGIQVDNPNRGFYERLGGRYLGERPLDWEGYQTTLVLFGFSITVPHHSRQTN